MWINYALAAKRLHDRNRSGWWLLAPTVTLVMAIGFAFVTLSLPEGQREPWNTIGIIFVFATVALGVWLFVEIGFLRGTQGPNGYAWPRPSRRRAGQRHGEAAVAMDALAVPPPVRVS